MRDTFRNPLLRHRVKDDIYDGFALEGKFDLGSGVLGSVVMILLDGLLQGRESLASVMKVGDGLKQSFARQIDQKVLEFSKCAPGLIRLLR
jgi:hypothetical protein